MAARRSGTRTRRTGRARPPPRQRPARAPAARPAGAGARPATPPPQGNGWRERWTAAPGRPRRGPARRSPPRPRSPRPARAPSGGWPAAASAGSRSPPDHTPRFLGRAGRRLVAPSGGRVMVVPVRRDRRVGLWLRGEQGKPVERGEGRTLDAYVLVHQAEDDVIDRLEQGPDVRFAARTVGAHVAVAGVCGAGGAGGVARGRWGTRAHETAIPLRPNPPHIKGMLPRKHEAFVGLTVAPPYERVQRAVAALRQLELPVAVHAVAGRYQVMAELASVDYHDLRDALLLDVPSIEGGTSITSSLAVFYNAPLSARPWPDGMDWCWRDPDPGPEAPELHWGTTGQHGT